MKNCPECNKPLGVMRASVLLASQGERPTECSNCGLYLRNTWYGELGAFAVLALLLADLFRTDSIIGSLPVPEVIVVVGYMAARYFFCVPKPYTGNKRWCPRCHKEDAIHDWSDDPTCIECEYKLRPGVRVKKLD